MHVTQCEGKQQALWGPLLSWTPFTVPSGKTRYYHYFLRDPLSHDLVRGNGSSSFKVIAMKTRLVELSCHAVSWVKRNIEIDGIF